jgi:hypothetical protein
MTDSQIAKVNERDIGFLARILGVVCRVYNASTGLDIIYREVGLKNNSARLLFLVLTHVN